MKVMFPTASRSQRLFLILTVFSVVIVLALSFRPAVRETISSTLTFLRAEALCFPNPSSPSLRPSVSTCPAKEAVSFSRHEEFESLSHSHDSLWEELVPSNGGFLILPSSDGQLEQYGVSMFHQLHCLGMLRSVVQGLQGSRAGAHKRYAHSHHGTMDMSDKHWQHCFDYLRQAILCNADPSIEEPRVNSNGKKVINGMVERQCRDARGLYDASMESFRYANEEIRSGRRKFEYHD